MEVIVALISLRQLLECGVHFGHPTRKWNPKMAPYIYTKRNGIHILDLQQTTRFIDGVHAYVQDLISQGKSILFVGTKKQAQDAIREEATKCGMPYINQRWLGGLLTNRATVTKRLERLRELRRQKEDGYYETLPKKDQRYFMEEMVKLEKHIGGIIDLLPEGPPSDRKEMRLPDALFIVDVKKETNAVMEARRLMIPIIGILDTNCDPDDVQHKLPGNDDAIRSIRLFCQIIADSVMEAKYGYLPPDSVFIRAAEEASEEEKAAKQLEALGPKRQKADKTAPVDPAAIIESVTAETVAAVMAPAAPETPVAAAPEAPAAVEEAPAAVEPPVLFVQNGEPAPEAAPEQN
jgi:small subunit ribosomal protein S2